MFAFGFLMRSNHWLVLIVLKKFYSVSNGKIYVGCGEINVRVEVPDFPDMSRGLSDTDEYL